MTQKTQNLIFAENILKLQKELRIAQDAINSLIQLETKQSQQIADLKNYQDKIIQWGGFY